VSTQIDAQDFGVTFHSFFSYSHILSPLHLDISSSQWGFSPDSHVKCYKNIFAFWQKYQLQYFFKTATNKQIIGFDQWLPLFFRKAHVKKNQ
jgi:hypothetical protein